MKPTPKSAKQPTCVIELRPPSPGYEGFSRERIQNHLRDTLLPWEITHVDKSDIMAVWMPHNEIWQGDWHNRMDRYYDEGKYEAGHNQLDLVFDKKPADDFKNMANSLGATITISDAQGRGKKTFRPEAVEN